MPEISKKYFPLRVQVAIRPIGRDAPIEQQDALREKRHRVEIELKRTHALGEMDRRLGPKEHAYTPPGIAGLKPPLVDLSSGHQDGVQGWCR